jgi:hypothetical protein
LPSERAKNGRAHDIHLTEMALEVIGKIPRIVGSDFLFSVTGKKPVASYADAKVRIDKGMAEILGSVVPWTYPRHQENRGNGHGGYRHRAPRGRSHFEPRIRHDQRRRPDLTATNTTRSASGARCVGTISGIVGASGSGAANVVALHGR